MGLKLVEYELLELKAAAADTGGGSATLGGTFPFRLLCSSKGQIEKTTSAR